MKFSILGVIINDKLEDKAVSIAKAKGAGAVTILRGQNIPLKEKKIFLGLTYEESVSFLVFLLPSSLSLQVMKTLKEELELDKNENGFAFTAPISHLAGLSVDEIDKFGHDIFQTL